MANTLTAKILRVSEGTFLDDHGKVNYTVAVQYKVGDHGPFTVTLPRDGFTADAAMLAMKPTVDAINKLPV